MARKSPAQDAVARQSEFSPIGRSRVQVTFDEPEVLDWLERNGVHDALGLATNAVLPPAPAEGDLPGPDRQDVRALAPARGLPGCRGVRTHCRAGLRWARHLTRDRAAPAVVTNGGKRESARILTFPTEQAYITGSTGHQAAAL